MDRKKKGTGVEFYQRVTGQKIGTRENLSLWTASLNGAPKTNDMKEAAIRKLASAFPTLQNITKREVQLWAQKLITEGGLSPKTVRRDLSFCRQYWRYLQNIEIVDENLQPFDNLQINHNNRQAIKARRKAFTPEEVVALHSAAMDRNDQPLADLIELAMWTGGRIEELCSLKVEHVTDMSFKIVDAKTDHGWRTIPLHSQLKPTMKRLMENSKDGYVLSGLSLTNKYAKRSNGIGKRFGRLKDELGFDRSTQVFHSIRKTVMTLLKNAEVPEVIAADIAGHSKPTLTYGLYPGDPDFQVVKAAIEKLQYPQIAIFD
jgi:integrase